MGKKLKVNGRICLYNKDMQKNVKGLIHWLLGELEIEWIETRMGKKFSLLIFLHFFIVELCECIIY